MQLGQMMKTLMMRKYLMIMTAFPWLLNPYKTDFFKIQEWKMKMKEGKLKQWTWKMKEWTQKMKYWTMISYLLSEKDISLRNTRTTNYHDGRENWRSMGWSNLIVGSHALHNIVKSYVNKVNTISIFVEPTTPSNIITNKTTLIQYNIKKGLNFLEKM